MTGVLAQVVAMAAFLALGAWRPRNGGPHWPTVARNLANGALLFGLRVTLVAAVVERAGPGWLDLAAVGPAWARFLVAFVLLDLARYWVHRLDHRVPWLWHFHRVHHSAERLDATTGLRMHLVDFVQLSAIPVVLFSVLLDTTATPGVVDAALAAGVVSDAFQHSDLRFDAGRGLGRLWDLLLNNPHFHAWHHTRDGARVDGNYGNVLTIWDRLFGSCVSAPEPPEAYGLEPAIAIEESVIGWQLLRPRRAGA